jgi:hypothetical protein
MLNHRVDEKRFQGGVGGVPNLVGPERQAAHPPYNVGVNWIVAEQHDVITLFFIFLLFFKISTKN